MRASEKAYTELRRDIVEWRLAPGSVLGEVDQAERLGVSRTPLREALARLVSDGLAVQQRGRGVIVSDVSLEHIDHLFQLRRALEVEAARTAATTAATGKFTDLATRFTRAATPTGTEGSEDYYELAAELDRSIDDCIGNPYLEQALRSLRVHLARVRRLAQDDPARLRTSAGEHAQIAAAIAARNPELAAAATLLHLHHSLEHIRTHAGTREETT